MRVKDIETICKLYDSSLYFSQLIDKLEKGNFLENNKKINYFIVLFFFFRDGINSYNGFQNNIYIYIF